MGCPQSIARCTKFDLPGLKVDLLGRIVRKLDKEKPDDKAILDQVEQSAFPKTLYMVDDISQWWCSNEAAGKICSVPQHEKTYRDVSSDGVSIKVPESLKMAEDFGETLDIKVYAKNTREQSIDFNSQLSMTLGELRNLVSGMPSVSFKTKFSTYNSDGSISLVWLIKRRMILMRAESTAEVAVARAPFISGLVLGAMAKGELTGHFAAAGTGADVNVNADLGQGAVSGGVSFSAKHGAFEKDASIDFFGGPVDDAAKFYGNSPEQGLRCLDTWVQSLPFYPHKWQIIGWEIMKPPAGHEQADTMKTAHMAVIGPIGAGKSSLLDTLCDYAKHQDGTSFFKRAIGRRNAPTTKTIASLRVEKTFEGKTFVVEASDTPGFAPPDASFGIDWTDNLSNVHATFVSTNHLFLHAFVLVLNGGFMSKCMNTMRAPLQRLVENYGDSFFSVLMIVITHFELTPDTYSLEYTNYLSDEETDSFFTRAQKVALEKKTTCRKLLQTCFPQMGHRFVDADDRIYCFNLEVLDQKNPAVQRKAEHVRKWNMEQGHMMFSTAVTRKDTGSFLDMRRGRFGYACDTSIDPPLPPTSSFDAI